MVSFEFNKSIYPRQLSVIMSGNINKNTSEGIYWYVEALINIWILLNK